MECGKAIEVEELSGAIAVRFIAQCGGQFLVISHLWDTRHRNGYLLADWRAVARELVALTVPKSLAYEKGRRARSMADGFYHDLELSYPLSVNQLAGVLGEDAEAVRELLADLAVQAE